MGVTVWDMMKRFEAVDVSQLAVESIEDTRNDLIEWQKEQLFLGKKQTGSDITPFYKPATIREKKKKGQPTDRVTLKDTGVFYNAVFVDVRSAEFVIDSEDRKAPWLIDKYGESIFGLGGVFKVGYISELQPVFVDKVRERLRL